MFDATYESIVVGHLARKYPKMSVTANAPNAEKE